MRIFLNPLETLLFRNGRPFNAGEVGYAETIFPPTPETMQGVVRALIATYWDKTLSMEEVFQQKDSELVKLIGDYNGYGRLLITNIALVRWTGDNPEPLYPVPAHILREEKTKKLFLLKPEILDGVISNMPPFTRYFLTHKKPKYKLEPADGWLTKRDLDDALQAKTDDDLKDIKIISHREIFEREFRVGIGVDSSRKAVEEGLLYSTQMIRMKEEYYPSKKRYGFLIEMYIVQENKPTQENELPKVSEEDTQNIYDKLKSGGWATMGGEKRAVRFEVKDNPYEVSTKKGNLLYLATPAVFSDGWKPEGLSTEVPIAAAVSRYQPIGGWKLEPGKSGGGSNKVMRRCVPAGSVYFFDHEIAIPPAIGSVDTTQIGYGITRTGVWK